MAQTVTRSEIAGPHVTVVVVVLYTNDADKTILSLGVLDLQSIELLTAIHSESKNVNILSVLYTICAYIMPLKTTRELISGYFRGVLLSFDYK